MSRATPPSPPAALEVPAGGPLDVLVVCTANISRSPVAAALFARHLDARGVAARVTSAGTIRTHLDVDPHSVAIGDELGLDLSQHRPRPIDDDLLRAEGTDLIVVMERAHAREISMVDPDAWRRTFTLKELARAARSTRPAGADARVWCLELGAKRSMHALLGDDPADDVTDTYGTSLAAHRRTAKEFDVLIGHFAARIPVSR